MAKRMGGMRRKTRGKLSKHKSQKGKVNITRYFQELKDGEKVLLAADSAIHKGMYFPRFHGRVGIIQTKKGKCYEVQINDLGKKKSFMVHPVHLKKIL